MVRIEKNGLVWTIIHSRPEARNAMSREMNMALQAALADATVEYRLGCGEQFPPDLLDDFATYHLIADATDVINSQYNGSSDGVHMAGALVYDGDVYDHIEFENRGEASTYVSGKNKWRIHFNRARRFDALDSSRQLRLVGQRVVD